MIKEFTISLGEHSGKPFITKDFILSKRGSGCEPLSIQNMGDK